MTIEMIPLRKLKPSKDKPRKVLMYTPLQDWL